MVCGLVVACYCNTPKIHPCDRNSLHAVPPHRNSLPLTTLGLVTISQEHVTDTMKHNEPLCPFAAEPFEGYLIDGEGRMQLPESAVFGCI
jgi:hypothetical protein